MGKEKKNTTYLADLENEGGKGYIKVLEELEEGDALHLVYTNRGGSLDFATLDIMLKSLGKIMVEKAYTGDNALDFQLSSLLGNLIAGDKERRYVILSNDHGYDPLTDFWKDRGVDVRREEYRCGAGSELKPDACQTKANNAGSWTDNGTLYEGDIFREQKIKIVKLLKQKGLTGYDVNKLAVIFRGPRGKYQDRIVETFGQEKSAEFFEKTTKKERKALRE